jgi:adenosylcobinamide kinase/adenosylcobinamide-phosphate guanylyltransferase
VKCTNRIESQGGGRMIFIIGGACQGKTVYAKENFGESYQIINQYHLQVKEQLKEGKEPLTEAENLLQEKENCIIISDEIGYGLVPTDRFERLYRETSGRVNCYFASQAKQVIRVISGIGIRIK